MVLRRRARQLVQFSVGFIVLVGVVWIVHSWNSFSHQELDSFVKKRSVPHEEGDDGNKALADAFAKADENGDGFLSGEEIERWITQKTREHLDEGEEEMVRVFKDVDTSHDNAASWDEWSTYVHRHPAILHAHDHDGKKPTLEDTREEWEVADSDHNDQLNPHEFQCFRHPELCRETLDQLTKDVIKNLDKDGDGKLTEAEYTAPPPGQVEEGFQDYEIRFKEQRQREFQTVDTNKDGVVVREELRVFLNPRNHVHAKTEAGELVDAADENQDGRLSLTEVIGHKDLFQQSKLMDVGGTFHHDF